MAQLSNLAMMMARPSFGQGLFNVGQAAGKMPLYPQLNKVNQQETQRAAEGEQGLLQIMQMQAQGASPEEIAAVTQSLAAKTGKPASEIALALNAGRQQHKEALQNKGKQAIARILSTQDTSKPQIVKAIHSIAMQTGVPLNELPTLMGESSPWKVSGNNMFNTETGEWSAPPTQEDVGNMTLNQIANLKEKFTNESVNTFLKDPTANLVLRDQSDAKGDESTQDKQAQALNRLASFDVIDSAYDKAINLIQNNPKATGLDAQATAWLESSPAGQLQATYNTLQSQEFLNWITDLKKEAGGIGAISNAEGERFTDAVKALRPGMDRDQQIENLDYIREFRRRVAITGDGQESDFYKQDPANPGVYFYRSISGKLYKIKADGTAAEITP